MPSYIRAYCAYNVLNLPAGIVPTTRVTTEDDQQLDDMPSDDLVMEMQTIYEKMF